MGSSFIQYIKQTVVVTMEEMTNKVSSIWVTKSGNRGIMNRGRLNWAGNTESRIRGIWIPRTRFEVKK